MILILAPLVAGWLAYRIAADMGRPEKRISELEEALINNGIYR